jgi:hypothetical protein
MRIGLACLVSLLLLIAACSDDEGGTGTVDGGNSNDASQVDSFVPMANCTPLDLANAPAITIVNQDITPNPQGGNVPGGTFKLMSVKLDASGITVNGTAKARIEFVAGTATSGAARVALIIDATALGMPVEQDVTGAGLYTVTGTSLNLAEGCGGSNPLSGLTYTAAAAGVTIWTSYMVTDPIALTIPIELLFVSE